MNQVLWFICTVFAVTWGLSLVAPQPPESLASFLAWFVPGVWAPTVVAVILLLHYEGREGALREIAARLRYQPDAARWLIVAAVLPAAAVLVAVVAARAVGHGAPFISSEALLQTVGIQLITGAVGEELGWRGFLLPRLRTRFGAALAAWVMGLLWSLWHIPAFYTPGMPHQSMPMFLVLTFVVFFGVFMALVFSQAGESVLATMSAHVSLNVTTALGGSAFSSPVYWGLLASVFGVLAVSATLGLRKLRRSNERLADMAIPQMGGRQNHKNW